jgi:hypothetical protein
MARPYYELPSVVLYIIFSYILLRRICRTEYIVTDLITALPDNNSVITVQHTTLEKAVFSVDPTDATVDWLDSDHMMCLLQVDVRSAAI